MSCIDFEKFQENFKQRLASTSLRTTPGTVINRVDPAIREIRNRSVTGLLEDRRFLASVNRSVRKFAQKLQKKEEIISMQRDLVGAVKQVRYAQNTLGTLQARVRDIDRRLGSSVGLAKQQLFYEVIEKLCDTEYALSNFERDLVSLLPAHKRKPGYRTPKWETFLKPRDSKLREKVAIRRLWNEIDQKLQRLLAGKKISAITRFTILSALLESAGIGRIEPTTLKQHFYIHGKTKVR